LSEILQRVAAIVPPGEWAGPADDRVTLDYDARHRRRIVLNGDHGLEALLDLPQAVLIPHGAGLKLQDGRIIEVLAAPEKLMAITADGPEHLLRLAWHIGNRHLTAQIGAERILIRHDRVIGHMLEHLGAKVEAVSEPFDPEGGAYGGVHAGHNHDH
jgi:urease accessory protein